MCISRFFDNHTILVIVILVCISFNMNLQKSFRLISCCVCNEDPQMISTFTYWIAINFCRDFKVLDSLRKMSVLQE